MGWGRRISVEFPVNEVVRREDPTYSGVEGLRIVVRSHSSCVFRVLDEGVLLVETLKRVKVSEGESVENQLKKSCFCFDCLLKIFIGYEINKLYLYPQIVSTFLN